MASKVMRPTSSALTLPDVTALRLFSRPTCCERVSAPTGMGRLRSASMMPVGTKYGHSTDAPMGAPIRSRSWYSDSESEMTASLETL